ncbi:RecT protein [Pseudoalteromonas phage B8b]|uniref:RecT protein n=1 Tax=Pseudoalteromonas phage B8b TaxID=1506997 RepID=A0A076G5E2_9CAUD|nr:RecT protein [Pseudoalteromonas phage B8b]|tara:strand:- start:1904 stop:2809 length:906 start_codon:yes stop_codon:yes gene_type:complete
MSQGIFEQLLAAQLKTNTILEEILRSQGKTVAATLEQTVDAVTEQGTTTVTENKADASAPEQETDSTVGVELDSAGVPWDERIHSSNKKKLAKGGTWQKKRGVEDALHAEITAQLLNGRKLAAEQNQAIEAGTTVPQPDKAPVLTDTPAPPPPPGAAAAGKTAPPPPPGAAAADDRQLAISAIDKLCTPYDLNSTSTLQAGVLIDTFNCYCTEYYGVPTFAEVAPEHYPQIISQCEQWASELAILNKHVKSLLDAYAADVSLIHDHIVNVLGAANTGQVDFSQIIATKQRVEQYAATVLQG